MFSARIGTGMPFIMIHGNAVDHRLLLPLEPAYDGIDVERLYLDMPGFGQTPPDPAIASMDDLAEAVLAAVIAEVDEQPFALVANSMGSLIARHIIAERPHQVLGLCLICPVVIAEQDKRTLPDQKVMVENQELIDSLSAEDRDDYLPMAVLQTRENVDRYQEFVQPGVRAADQATMDRLERSYALRQSPEWRFGTFTRPTLVVTGRQDNIVGYRDQLDVMDHYPNSTCVTLSPGGHNIIADQPEAVIHHVHNWAKLVVTGA